MQNKHLAAMSPTEIPDNFNWRDNGPDSIRRNMTTPGNQLLCGSCWAISAAGITGDNFVVSKLVDWKPDLSTTYSLACYRQKQCKGGNSAKLFQDISSHGLRSNSCIDYGWCEKNPKCSGKATKHFKASATMDLSSLVPDCGCIFATDHYLYKVDPPTKMALGKGGLTSTNFALTVKKHIKVNGPVLGGFLVFKNFMHGIHANPELNNGVYLETGTYDEPGVVKFNKAQASPANYVGNHAVAIIGWGIAKDTVIDNNGTKKDVPYWQTRNSWGTKWGDKGYFKMAMYPYNKLSQFDMSVTTKTKSGTAQAGGMVAIKATKPPELVKAKATKVPVAMREKPNSFYQSDTKVQGSLPASTGKSHSNLKKIGIIIGVTLGGLLVCGILVLSFLLIKSYWKKHSGRGGRRSGRRGGRRRSGRSGRTGRSGSYH